MKWFKATVGYNGVWCLIEIRAYSMEDMRLRLRQIIRSGAKISNIEERSDGNP